MGIITNRVIAVSLYLFELLRRGVPTSVGPLDKEGIFILDGVGGFQFSPLLIRRVLRRMRRDVGTIIYKWQFGLPGDIWSDLMWLKRNRVMGAKFARKLLAFRRDHPHTKIHVVAFSGGVGVALFGLESLRGRPLIDTLLLACPAVSPKYNLAPALRSVKKAYAMISHRDRGILGVGTSIFGTTDRHFGAAAGLRGFQLPSDVSECTTRLRVSPCPWAPPSTWTAPPSCRAWPRYSLPVYTAWISPWEISPVNTTD